MSPCLRPEINSRYNYVVLISQYGIVRRFVRVSIIVNDMTKIVQHIAQDCHYIYCCTVSIGQENIDLFYSLDNKKLDSRSVLAGWHYEILVHET